MKKLALLFSLLAGFLFLPQVTTHAAGAGFTAAPIMPSNQNPKQTGYFDIEPKAGSTQTLSLRLQNTSNTNQHVTVTPTDSFSQDNGVIGYTPNTNVHPTDAPVLSEMTTKAQSITLKPKATQDVHFKVTIPKSGFSGRVLGAFYVLGDVQKNADSQSAGFSLQNRFAMVIGVQLRSKTSSNPNLALNNATVKTVDGKVNFVANIDNLQSDYFKDLKLDVTVKSKKHTYKRNVTKYGMAPNSRLSFLVPTNLSNLPAGTYRMNVTATTQKKTWHFMRDITVKNGEVTHSKVVKAVTKPNSFPTVLAVVIGLIVVVLAGGGWWLSQRRKRR